MVIGAFRQQATLSVKVLRSVNYLCLLQEKDVCAEQMHQEVGFSRCYPDWTGCLSLFSFWCPGGKMRRGHLKAIKSGFCLITKGFFPPPIKTFKTNLPPLRTLVSPCGMARNQQWEINKWPLKNIAPRVKTHIHSRAAPVHMSTHSLPISSALFAKTLLSNEVVGLRSHRAKRSSVIPECCFPSQPSPLLKVILTNQDSLQHQIYECTAHHERSEHTTAREKK